MHNFFRQINKFVTFDRSSLRHDCLLVYSVYAGYRILTINAGRSIIVMNPSGLLSLETTPGTILRQEAQGDFFRAYKHVVYSSTIAQYLFINN